MNVRFVLAAVLVTGGLAVPAFAVWVRGAPWGFRGHRGVVVEQVGDVVISPAARTHAQYTWLNDGDTVSVSRFGFLHARITDHDRPFSIIVTDAGSVRIGEQGVQQRGGTLEVVVPTSNVSRPARIEVAGADLVVLLYPTDVDGSVRIHHNGTTHAVAFVQTGRAEFMQHGAVVPVASGLVVDVDGHVRVEPPAQRLNVTAVCVSTDATAGAPLASLRVSAPAGTWLWTPGTLSFATADAMDFELRATQAVVSARDVVGNVWPTRTVPCTVADTRVSPRVQRCDNCAKGAVHGGP